MDQGNQSKIETRGGCMFYNRIKKNPVVYEKLGMKEAWDIEDLIKVLKVKKVSLSLISNNF